MEIRSEEIKGITILRLSEIHLRFPMALNEAIRRSIDGKKARVVLDLRLIPFLDSIGIGILAEARGVLDKIDGTLGIFGLSERGVQSFRISGLSAVIKIYASEEDALSE